MLGWGLDDEILERRIARHLSLARDLPPADERRLERLGAYIPGVDGPAPSAWRVCRPKRASRLGPLAKPVAVGLAVASVAAVVAVVSSRLRSHPPRPRSELAVRARRGAVPSLKPVEQGGRAGAPARAACRGSIGDDFKPCTATYLSGPGLDWPAAIDIAADGTVVYAGAAEALDPAVRSTELMGGGPAVVARLSADGRTLMSVSRVGATVGDVATSPVDGAIIVAGEPFGLAALDAGASNVLWRASVRAARLAVGADGAIAAVDAERGEVAVLTPSGRIASRFRIEEPSVSVADVAIDATTRTVIAAGAVALDKNGEGTRDMAWLRGYAYDGTVKWRGYGWSREQSGEAGLWAACRGVAVSLGRDGRLYYVGRSQGANSVHTRDPQDIGRRIAAVSVDGYTSLERIGNQAVAFIARLNPEDGRLERALFHTTRAPDGSGRSMAPHGVAADREGRVYVTGYQTCCMEGQDHKSVGAVPVAPSGRDAFVLSFSPDFERRLLWTTFGRGGASYGTGIAVRGGNAALIAVQEFSGAGAAPLVTVDALQPHPGGGLADAFLVVWRIP